MKSKSIVGGALLALVIGLATVAAPKAHAQSVVVPTPTPTAAATAFAEPQYTFWWFDATTKQCDPIAYGGSLFDVTTYIGNATQGKPPWRPGVIIIAQLPRRDLWQPLVTVCNTGQYP